MPLYTAPPPEAWERGNISQALGGNHNVKRGIRLAKSQDPRKA